MNKFQINAIPVFESSESSNYSIQMIISIDGKPLNSGYDIAIYDILDLVNNRQERIFEHFWTCDCGINGCAGIVDLNIIDRGDNIYCIFPDNISTSNYQLKNSYEEWKKQKFNTYKFSKTDIQQELLILADNIDFIINTHKNYNFMRFNNGSSDWGVHYEAPFNLSDYIRSDIKKIDKNKKRF